MLVQAAFIADADAVGIVAAGMGSYHLIGTADMELAVAGDVVMVAGGLEAAGLVAGLQVFDGEVLRGLRGGTVDNNQINTTHRLEG